LSKLFGCLTVLAKLRRSGWTPELIHAHEYEAGRTALMLSRVVRVPVVVSEHWSGFAVGTLVAHERDRARRAFERAAVVCPDSRDLAPRLRRIAPAARFEPVPNAVDTTIFHPNGDAPSHRERRPLRLVTVASLVEVKGHRYLLDALALLAPDRDLELDLIGEGPLREELADRADSLGLDGKVRLHGTRPRPAVAAALRAADVFVLPSLWENMPCALLEAMACGLPSVATRVGDVAEVVDGDAGVVVAPRSAEELAAGIAAVSSRLDRYDPAELAGRAEARYGFAAIGRRWTEVYATALTAGP
jgi:glycosyltransferase involved in cell wall biosynthesis